MYLVTFHHLIVVGVSLTEPELSTQIPEASNVVLPTPEEVHRAVLPPLEDLQTGNVQTRFHRHKPSQNLHRTFTEPSQNLHRTFTELQAEEHFTHRPASSVRLHVAVDHHGRPEFPLREDLHLS